MQFTHEHLEIQKTLKRFIDTEINPHVDEWEAAEMFPAHEVFKKMGTLGLLGVTKPVELKISQFYCAPHPMMKKDMCGAEASASIKRSEFGMNRYMPGIGDDIKISVQLEAFKA